MGQLVDDGRVPFTYAMGLGTLFSAYFDIRIPDPTVFGAQGGAANAITVYLPRLQNSGRTAYLDLVYNRMLATPQIQVWGSDGQTNGIDVPGDGELRLKVCVVQTATDRRLYVYNYSSKVAQQQVISATPVGALSQVVV
jgi:hypothetical protein